MSDDNGSYDSVEELKWEKEFEKESVRFSFSKMNSIKDIDIALDRLSSLFWVYILLGWFLIYYFLILSFSWNNVYFINELS